MPDTVAAITRSEGWGKGVQGECLLEKDDYLEENGRIGVRM